MLAVREGDDELAFIVDQSVDFNSILLLEDVRRDEISLVSQELIAVLGIHRPRRLIAFSNFLASS